MYPSNFWNKALIQQTEQVMTDKEYYLWSNTGDKQIQELVNPCSFLCVFFLLTKMYIAALGFEFCNSILTNKIHCTNHEMQAANKPNKNARKRHVGGLNLASLNCAFLPRAWGISINYRLFLFPGSILLHYIGHFFGENIFLYVGCSRGNFFDNLKHRTLVCKNELQ